MNLIIPSLVIINAEQGSGKTTLIRYLMYQNRKKFDYGVVFTNTLFEAESFDYIPKKYVHPEYDPDVLKNLMNIQSTLIEKGVIKEAFVIFDDCIEASQFKDPELKNLCMQLRHYHITVIFSTQYAVLVPSWMRANAMGVCIFKSESENNLKALFGSYAQSFGTFSTFKNYVMENLGNHKFIWYDKMRAGPDISIGDKFQLMKAPAKVPNFKIRYQRK